MLITKVKVDKVTNLSEARYCAGMGVDFLSFPVSSVDPKTYQEITGWVAGPLFGIEARKEDLEKVSTYNFDFIQLAPELIDSIVTDKKVIVSFPGTDWFEKKTKLIAAKDKTLFLELKVSELDSTIEETIHEASKEFQLLIKCPESIDLERILKLPIAGISLEGGQEDRPGLKEYPLANVLEYLDQD